MNNAIEQRLKFIELMIIDYGSIKRETVSKYFGISLPQATRDLNMYDELCGGVDTGHTEEVIINAINKVKS
jgi:hypothetical protein